jgi:hypothetical protein
MRSFISIVDDVAPPPMCASFCCEISDGFACIIHVVIISRFVLLSSLQ